MLSKRTKISLSQFLDLQKIEFATVLLNKYNMNISSEWMERYRNYKRFGKLSEIEGDEIIEIKDSLLNADEKDIFDLLNEIVITQDDLKRRISSKDSFYNRWNDLENCLAFERHPL